MLPWGSDDERARSERLAAAISGAVVPPRLPLGGYCVVLARCALRDRRRHGAHASRRRAGHGDGRDLHRDRSGGDRAARVRARGQSRRAGTRRRRVEDVVAALERPRRDELSRALPTARSRTRCCLRRWRASRGAGGASRVIASTSVSASAATTAAPQAAPLIWVHAVSVGETRAAEPLVRALLERYPRHRILLTHMTPTGPAHRRRRFSANGVLRCLPARTTIPARSRVSSITSQPRVRRAHRNRGLAQPRPRASNARGIPLYLVNARLSEKSLRGYLRVSRRSRGEAFAGAHRGRRADRTRMRERLRSARRAQRST